LGELLTIATIAAFILGFGLISQRIQTTVITPPMVFVVFGMLVSPQLLGLVGLHVGHDFIDILAEFTLVLVLFTDASRIDLKLLRKRHDIPLRLLAIGLPLTMVAGTLVGALLFDFVTIWEAAVLAVILAPTDAALGQAVVSSRQVPVRIRQALNVESGLNDGIALPFLFFFISLASAVEETRYEYWLQFAAMQIILGPIVGVAIGYIGGLLVSRAEEREWMAETFQKLASLGLALLAFSVAELVGGNGFIAAFVAGLTLGNLFPRVCGRLYDFAEAEGQLLTLLAFLLFGAIMVWPAIGAINLWIVIYAILSLTVVRLIPVAISLIGLRLQWDTILFLGWFGPRGIASIIYGLIILEEGTLRGRHNAFTVMVITVLFSVFAHGLTAVPAVNAYGARTEAMADEPDTPEMIDVPEMPVRLRWTAD
jgi:NhaP-type Na+/H+ or K+/H+ antiporter